MPTPEQQKLIRKYCLLPSFVLPSFLMPILTAVVSMVLITIDQALLRGKPVFMPLFAEIMLPMFAYVVIGIYCMFSVVLGIRSKKWKALVQDLAARNHLQPYDNMELDEETHQWVKTGTLTYEETVDLFARHPAEVAELAHMEIPSIKRLRRTVLLLPVLLQIVCFIPQLVTSYEAMEERKAQAGAVLEQLSTAFTPIAEDVHYDDPQERYSDAGYDFYAYLSDTESDERNYLAVKVNEDGLIYDISYYCDIDVHRTKEENMTKVQQTFATLHTALLNSGVNLTSSAHTEVYDMSDRFWTVFTEGSYYRDYSIDNDEYDDANVFYSYYTEPEEEYDENSSSYVSLIISTKYSSR